VKILREFRRDAPSAAKIGDVIEAGTFVPGEYVDASGVSKGKGFQGVVKRHHFAGGPASHGHKDNLRMPGSIGAGGIQKVFKGMRMGGRMGGDTVTVKNLEVIEVDAAKGILAIKGAIPGARGAEIIITGGGTEKRSWN
ncbi:MAG TPA: 50S ribosomal protein L3, partial [Usitatibacter sp.]